MAVLRVILFGKGPIMRHPPILPTPVIPLSATGIRSRCGTILILFGQSAFTTQTFQLGNHICFKGGKHVLHLLLNLKSAVPHFPLVKFLIDDLFHLEEICMLDIYNLLHGCKVSESVHSLDLQIEIYLHLSNLIQNISKIVCTSSFLKVVLCLLYLKQKK